MPLYSAGKLIHKRGLPCDPDILIEADKWSELTEAGRETLEFDLCPNCYENPDELRCRL